MNSNNWKYDENATRSDMDKNYWVKSEPKYVYEFSQDRETEQILFISSDNLGIIRSIPIIWDSQKKKKR